MGITTESKINRLEREVRLLKRAVSNLVPIDTEGAYKKSFLKKIERARKSKIRYVFKNGTFRRVK